MRAPNFDVSSVEALDCASTSRSGDNAMVATLNKPPAGKADHHNAIMARPGIGTVPVSGVLDQSGLLSVLRLCGRGAETSTTPCAYESS